MIHIYKQVLKDQSANSDRYLLCRESARGCYDSDLAALTYGSYIIKVRRIVRERTQICREEKSHCHLIRYPENRSVIRHDPHGLMIDD